MRIGYGLAALSLGLASLLSFGACGSGLFLGGGNESRGSDENTGGESQGDGDSTCSEGSSDCGNACAATPSPCAAAIPSSTCDGDVLTEYSLSGCTSKDIAPFYECTYAPEVTDCTLTGGICRGGACIDNPCLPNPCAKASECEGPVTVTTYADGTCEVDANNDAYCATPPVGTTVVCTPATPVCQEGACAEDCGPGVVCPADYYLAPDGSDSNPGTADQPFATLTKVWTVIAPGDLVYARGGTYAFTSQPILQNKSGTADQPIRVWAYPGEQPVFTKGAGYTATYGIRFNGNNYFHLRGWEITGFAQLVTGNSFGILVQDSSHNIFELFNSHHNGHGMTITDGTDGVTTDNLVLNSDFHHNQDPYTAGYAYGNADGIALAYLAEDRVNTVRGCRLWWNTDDGLDLWTNDGLLTVEDTWAWYNGYIPDTFDTGGDGNGLKLGKTSIAFPGVVKRHVRNCLSFKNRASGLSQNNGQCRMEISNNTFYKNAGSGIWLWGLDDPNILRNNISYDNGDPDLNNQYAVDESHNSWDDAYSVSDADFQSLVLSGVDGPRQPDGSLPNLPFLKLAPTSDLIDGGVDLGRPFNGSAPDLGAFETED